MNRLLMLVAGSAVICGCSSTYQAQIDALANRVAKLESAASAERLPASNASAPTETEANPGGYPGEVAIADWLMTGVGAPDFSVVADGDAVRIQQKVEGSERFVALIRVVPAEEYVGKKVAASLEVRSEGLEHPAVCVLKVQTERKLAYKGFLGGDFVEVNSDSRTFGPCSVSADVPEGAKWILFGASYRGKGTVWVRAPRLEAKAWLPNKQ